ncbi:MAG: peptidoglycan hydrolase-like protein with peptidoglycan-binding domain [Ilumatobacter sp.]|jgi:peptidoglycan hydrolase-like protein with peptidoglycan-binding domain
MIRCAAVLTLALTVVGGCTSSSGAGVPIPGAGVDTTATITAPEVATTAPEAAPQTVATTAAPVVATEPPITEVATTVAPPVTEAPAPTDPPPAPVVFFRLGDEGPEVSIMQLKLVTLGYLLPGYTDSVFGQATAQGLREFQGQYGLGVDGVFGPLTNRALTAAAQSVNVED